MQESCAYQGGCGGAQQAAAPSASHLLDLEAAGPGDLPEVSACAHVKSYTLPAPPRTPSTCCGVHS